MSEVIIRKATEADLESMAKLLSGLFEIESDFAVSPVQQLAGLKLLLQAGRGSFMLVAEFQKCVIGMCSVQLLVSTAEGGLKAVLEDLIIAEAYRNQGIGNRLLTAIEGWACSQGAKRLDLLADCRNTRALTFYEQHGWQATNLVALQKRLPRVQEG